MKYKTVTIWHKTNDGNYLKTICNRTYISTLNTADTSGCGITDNRALTARCFTKLRFPISPGDRISIGQLVSPAPPFDALIIKEIKDNFDASVKLRHYRLECV